jgi:hypothetical protein
MAFEAKLLFFFGGGGYLIGARVAGGVDVVLFRHVEITRTTKQLETPLISLTSPTTLSRPLLHDDPNSPGNNVITLTNLTTRTTQTAYHSSTNTTLFMIIIITINISNLS